MIDLISFFCAILILIWACIACVVFYALACLAVAILYLIAAILLPCLWIRKKFNALFKS